MSKPNDLTHRITIELCWSRHGLLSLLAVLIGVAALFSITVVLARTGPSAVPPSPALTASTVVSYQGRFSVNGQPFNGTGKFKFAIVNADGTAAYWSNDGTGLTTPPFTPTQSVTLTVNNGLFSVLLGDTSLANMTRPLKPDAFAAPDRLLRVWFDDGVHGFQQLSPDVRVASAPYAFNAEFARTSPNLQRIALLKWYTAISTTQVFTVGLSPWGIAFDGTHMWVANHLGNSINVLRPSDGFKVMTPTVSLQPVGMAYDGANMWVVSYGSSSVNVLRANDGAPIATYPVGSQPTFIAFDGSNMWISSSTGNYVSVLRTSDGVHVMTPTVGTTPQGIAFDGTNMWVVNNGESTVSVLRASDGSPVMTRTVGLGPNRIAFDGVNMWITNYNGGSVTVLRASDGTFVATYPVPGNPQGIAFDGANMWITNFSEGIGHTVTVLRASDGALVKNVEVGAGPRDAAFDGVNMWITNNGGSANTVSKR